MFDRFNLSVRLSSTCVLLALLSGCASYKLWPLSSDTKSADPTLPENAIAYRCAGGKKFYIRELEKGQAIWLILPDREFSLSKQNDPNLIYANGTTRLLLEKTSAVLEISPNLKWLDCVSDKSAIGK